MVEDIYPRVGPSLGTGIINFYGEGFRDDYSQVEIECKIGENVGKGQYVSKNQLKCVIEEIDLVPEGETLPA